MRSLLDRPNAFAHFFDETIAVEGVRAGGGKVAGTYRACIMDGGLADIDADAVAGSNEKLYSVLIHMADREEPEPPWRGLTVKHERCGGRFTETMKVLSVDTLGGDFVLHCETKGAVNA